MSTLDIQRYYAGLLIIQYIGKPKAYATIETYTAPLILSQETLQALEFSAAPTSGQFTLSYDEQTTAAIAFNANAAAIQTALRALTGLSDITVTGSFADGFIVSFIGVSPVAFPLIAASNSLLNGVTPVTITITETDETLPFAIQNGYNLTGDNIASGNQLDILGKYVGVTRTAKGFTQQITLNDSDFLSLIKIAILKNNAGSDLYTIQQLLFEFFPNQIFVFDFKNMRMSYLISSSVGSQYLIELFITQNLLPVPMAVELASIIYAPIIDAFYGFCDYELPAPLSGNSPMNDYLDYRTDYPWLDYQDAITA